MDSIQNAKRFPICYLSFNVGLSQPSGEYGSSDYELVNSISPDLPPVFTGFAGTGFTCNLSSDFPLKDHSWEFSLAGDYMQQRLDATSFLDENIDNPNVAGIGYYTSSTTSNYYYQHLGVYCGFTKSYGDKRFSFKIKFLAGCLFFNTPSINGALDVNPGIPTSVPVQNCQVNSGHESLFSFNLGLGGRAFLSHTLYLFQNADYIGAEKVDFTMPFQLTNPSNGAIIWNHNFDSTTRVFMFNITVGIGWAIY